MEADERIIDMRGKLKAAKEAQEKYAYENEAVDRELLQSIYDESVEVFGRKMVFQDRNFMDNLISLRVPENFTEMEPELVKQIYPMGVPPEVVLSDEAYDFSIGLQFTEYPLNKSKLRAHAQALQMMLERLGPQSRILGNEMTDCGSECIPIITCVTQAIDTTMYNFIFCASVEGRLFMGFVNFMYGKKKRLEPLAKEIVTSFRILGQKEEHHEHYTRHADS